MNTTAALPTATWETITPATATAYLEHNTANRSLRPAEVAKRARDMRAGNFLVTGDAIRFDWNGQLIDGQHRLSACIEADTPFITLVVRGLDPHTKIVIDDNTKRTPADALRFAGVDMHRTAVGAVARVAMSWERGYLQKIGNRPGFNPTKTEIIEWAANNPDVHDAIAMAGTTARDLGVRPAALNFATLLFLRISPADAREFIGAIAESRTDGPGDPRHALIRATRNAHEHPDSSTSRHLFLIFRAWNAWRDGQTLKQMHAPRDAQIPEPH